MPRSLELEQAIRAEPEHAQAYLVYADWLQQQGDPRGELAVVQAALEAAPSRELWSRQHQLFVEHGRELLGDLPEPADPCADHPAFKCTWRGGWMVSASISQFMEQELAPLYPALATCASSRFLTELTIGWARDYEPLLAAVALVGVPWRLRRLVYGVERKYHASPLDLGDLGAFLRHTPELRELVVCGLRMGFPELRLPELRVLDAAARDPSSAAGLVAGCPRLERVRLDFGAESRALFVRLQPLWEAKLPHLVELALTHTPFTGLVLGELLHSSFLPGLRRLDLSNGRLVDADVEAVVAHADRYAHLELLDLRGNRLSEHGAVLARKLCREVRVGEQGGPREWEG